ncbi:hypothetical protein [Bacteroides ihuae]|uniref:hypothetical protein n=1 Tax=Bacteroides ihuae TaxID=1852362 RepID=UPI0008D9E7FA|nr:hypothetical protein [Bacteroides ihuae]
MERKYNFIYEKLVYSEDDLVGLIAYGIYKRHKIEFITSIKEREHRDPNDDECNSFFVASTTESQLKKYRNDAEAVLSDIVMNAAGEELEQYEQEMLKDYQANIKAALPSNTKTIILSVVSSLLFSFILAIFFVLGQTSEKSTNDSVEKMIQKIRYEDRDSTNTCNFKDSIK